jgi:hypothetical protein
VTLKGRSDEVGSISPPRPVEVIVGRLPLGSACDVDDQCDSGLACLCTPGSGCSAAFRHGICSRSCAGRRLRRQCRVRDSPDRPAVGCGRAHPVLHSLLRRQPGGLRAGARLSNVVHTARRRHARLDARMPPVGSGRRSGRTVPRRERRAHGRRLHDRLLREHRRARVCSATCDDTPPLPRPGRLHRARRRPAPLPADVCGRHRLRARSVTRVRRRTDSRRARGRHGLHPQELHGGRRLSPVGSLWPRRVLHPEMKPRK